MIKRSELTPKSGEIKMTEDKKMISIAKLMGFRPEDVERAKAFCRDQQLGFYVSRTPLPEQVRKRLGRVVYLGFSVPEEEALESARRYFSEYCSGVKKE